MGADRDFQGPVPGVPGQTWALFGAGAHAGVATCPESLEWWTATGIGTGTAYASKPPYPCMMECCSFRKCRNADGFNNPYVCGSAYNSCGNGRPCYSDSPEDATTLIGPGTDWYRPSIYVPDAYSNGIANWGLIKDQGLPTASSSAYSYPFIGNNREDRYCCVECPASLPYRASNTQCRKNDGWECTDTDGRQTDHYCGDGLVYNSAANQLFPATDALCCVEATCGATDKYGRAGHPFACPNGTSFIASNSAATSPNATTCCSVRPCMPPLSPRLRREPVPVAPAKPQRPNSPFAANGECARIPCPGSTAPPAPSPAPAATLATSPFSLTRSRCVLLLRAAACLWGVRAWDAGADGFRLHARR